MTIKKYKKEVANKLHNTESVCKSNYLDQINKIFYSRLRGFSQKFLFK